MAQSSGGESNRYIAGLDGLRAVAVAAVLAYHLFPGVLPGGYIGVDIFFVISGFLISTLLINEYSRSGRIRFKKFWVRRARRLLPALFVTIIVSSAIALFVRGDILVGLGRQILGALTFSNNWVEVAAGSNYFDANNPHLFTNFWSLAVEEQFYLVWPLVILGLVWLMFAQRRSRVGIAVCGLLASVSAVAMIVQFDGMNATRVYYGTDTHVFGLMIGAMVAFWARSMVSETALRRLHQPFWSLNAGRVQSIGFAAAIGLTVLMMSMPDTSAVTYYGGLFMASIAAAAVLVATISYRGVLQRIFTLRPLEWIGIRSYGIYLWHWPLLILLGQLFPMAAAWVVPSLTLIATFIFAAASYRYVEMPVQAHGFRAFLNKGLKRRVPGDGAALMKWRLQPHPILLGCLVVTILAGSAVMTAPTKTQAQLQIEAGQRAIQLAQQPKSHPKVLPAHTPTSTQSTAAPTTPQRTSLITGDQMTVIGDSVTIASAPALQAKFPGILIDAEISRSLREGGFAAIDQLANSGNLRGVVVIALATNGYFGTDNLDKLIAQLGSRQIVFVTAHVTREWTGPNNDDLHKMARLHPTIKIAEWDALINAHPEGLGDDGIHPTTLGGDVYAAAISAALGQ